MNPNLLSSTSHTKIDVVVDPVLYTLQDLGGLPPDWLFRVLVVGDPGTDSAEIGNLIPAPPIWDFTPVLQLFLRCISGGFTDP